MVNSETVDIWISICFFFRFKENHRVLWNSECSVINTLLVFSIVQRKKNKLVDFISNDKVYFFEWNQSLIFWFNLGKKLHRRHSYLVSTIRLKCFRFFSLVLWRVVLCCIGFFSYCILWFITLLVFLVALLFFSLLLLFCIPFGFVFFCDCYSIWLWTTSAPIIQLKINDEKGMTTSIAGHVCHVQRIVVINEINCHSRFRPLSPKRNGRIHHIPGPWSDRQKCKSKIQ